jgi:hypothetical protein
VDDVGDAVDRLDGDERPDGLGDVAGLLGQLPTGGLVEASVSGLSAPRREPVAHPTDRLAPLCDDDELVVGGEGEDDHALGLGHRVELALGPVGEADLVPADVEARASVVDLGVERLPGQVAGGRPRVVGHRPAGRRARGKAVRADRA